MKSTDFIIEGATPENNFRQAFSQAKLPLQGVEVEMGEDDWDKISAKGVKLFRRGVQEKLQFRVECWWNADSDEASGKVFSQKNHMDKKYSQELDLEDDQLTLQEFVAKVNEFVSGFADAEREQYAQGERDYWASGATGMMPGAVHRK